MKGSFPTAALVIAVLSAGCSQPLSPSRSTPAASGSLSVEGAGTSTPFEGRLDGTVTVTPLQPPFASVFIAATGNATKLGRFSLEIPHLVNFATGIGVGTFNFTAANGDTLTAAFTGQAQTGGPTIPIVEHATISGGTGRFAGATGSFTVERVFDLSTNTTAGSFRGAISSGRD